MYGDTDTIRALARALRGRSDEIRAEADRLVRHTERVPWQGLAADAMRAVARDRVSALLQTAALHDDAADALDRHAREVDRLKALIATIEHRVARLIESACDRLAALGHGLLDHLTGAAPDPVDQVLARFVPPPPGSRDWLAVDLPGLGR